MHMACQEGFVWSDGCSSDMRVSAVLIFGAFWALLFGAALCSCMYMYHSGHPSLYMYCLHLSFVERFKGFILHASSGH